jgi:hypothetical protein
MLGATALLIVTRCQMLQEGYERYGLNPDYRYDIPFPQWGYKFVYDPENLPVEGETTLAGLDRMYPMGPISKWTFRSARTVTLKEKKYEVDRIVMYEERVTEEISGSGMTGFRNLEFIAVTCFIKDNKVIKTTVRHAVDDHGDWKPGPYHTGENNWSTVNRDWISMRDDLQYYWKQRDDEKQFDKYRESGEYFKEMWNRAADPVPGENVRRKWWWPFEEKEKEKVI